MKIHSYLFLPNLKNLKTSTNKVNIVTDMAVRAPNRKILNLILRKKFILMLVPRTNILKCVLIPQDCQVWKATLLFVGMVARRTDRKIKARNYQKKRLDHFLTQNYFLQNQLMSWNMMFYRQKEKSIPKNAKTLIVVNFALLFLIACRKLCCFIDV